MFQTTPWADALRPTLQTVENLAGHAQRLWEQDLKAWKAGRRAHLVFGVRRGAEKQHSHFFSLNLNHRRRSSNFPR